MLLFSNKIRTETCEYHQCAAEIMGIQSGSDVD